jgi:hypothetical protein
MNKLCRGLLLLAAAVACTCSVSPLVSGGSSQQGNGIMTGTALSPDGGPAAGATVRIRPQKYVQIGPEAETADAITDDNGVFTVRGIGQDSFTVEINDGAAAAVKVDAVYTTPDTTIDLGNRFLKPYAKISGIVDTTGSAGNRFFVQVSGLERLVPVGLDGGFSLTNLPEGTFDVHVVSSDLTTEQVTAEHVSIVSGATTPLSVNPGWRFMRQLYFNTTSSGAGVAGNVQDFPVLVRLSNSNCRFAELKKDGSDLRFAKSNGTPVPFEIERWDSAHGQAEIWVKVDTVYGNDSSHFMVMRWGNANATGVLKAGDVFDAVNGFEGVWHLSEDSGNVSDATAYANTGTNEGTVSMPGCIGSGRSFSTSRISMGASSNLCTLTDSITVSGWLKSTQQPDSTVSVIRHVGNFTALQFSAAHEWTSFWTVDSTGYSIVACPSWASTFGDGTWHYLTARFKAGQGCFVYRDGVPLSQNTLDTARLKTSTGAFFLGSTETGGEYFSGSLDEVRVERAFRSPDWVKLCFMNQKNPDALVVFK